MGAREALLEAAARPAATPTPVERVVVAEVLALRAILLNLHFAIATGDRISVQRMQQLIDRADADKLPHAIARLFQAAGRDEP